VLTAIINEQYVHFALPPTHVEKLLKHIVNDSKVRERFTDIDAFNDNTILVIHPVIGIHFYIKEQNMRHGLQIITTKQTFSQLFTEKLDELVHAGVFTTSRRATEFIGAYNEIDPAIAPKPIAKVSPLRPHNTPKMTKNVMKCSVYQNNGSTNTLSYPS